MTLIQLAVLALSLLLVNAQSSNNCVLKPSVSINSCCDLRIYSLTTLPSGVYKMNTGAFRAASAYCDMTTAEGGWIVIQRNRKGSPFSFARNWKEYEDGFGDLCSEFWYGLEAIHDLTNSGRWEMRVDFTKEDGSSSYIHYNQFKVGSASEEYRLTVGGYAGGDGDFFTTSSDPAHGRKFSTMDNDNDEARSTNCAIVWKSGWWYHSCFNINPNAQPPRTFNSVEIKIRPKYCILV